jgi:hypothetical protein
MGNQPIQGAHCPMDQIDHSGKQLQHRHCRAGSQEMIIKSKAIFETEGVWDDGMIEKILPDVGRLEDRLDVTLLENFLRANTRKHEQFWGLKDAWRDNNLVVGAESQFLTIWTNGLETCDCGSVEKELLRMRGREDSDIRFAFHEYIAGGAEAFVDRVHAVD